jgi:type VI secretion system protein VasD
MISIKKQHFLRTWRLLPVGVMLGIGAGLVACKSKPPKPPPPPPPVILSLSLAATADANPDSQGRPSPVVVRLYELKDNAAFADADIYALFDKEQATLGAALIAREEYELAPGETRAKELRPPLDAHFIGVVAAYRDIRNAQWRAQVAVPDKSKKLGIAVERASVRIAVY